MDAWGRALRRNIIRTAYETTATSVYKGTTNNEETARYLSANGGRVSNNLNKARKGIEVQTDKEKAKQCRLEIQEGITALQTEPQGDPFKTERALQLLQRNLTRADNLLRALNALS